MEIGGVAWNGGGNLWMIFFEEIYTPPTKKQTNYDEEIIKKLFGDEF